MNEIKFTDEELESIMSDFDDFNDDGGSNVEIQEIGLLDDLSGYKGRKFDGRFYISYLGLNPNTLVKEDLDFILFLVRQGLDGNRLSFLISNLESFHRHIQEKMNDLDSDDMIIASSISNKLVTGIRELKRLLSLNIFDVAPLKLNSDYEKNTEKLLSDSTQCKQLYEELVINNLNTKDVNIRYDIYNNLLDTLYLMYSQQSELKNKKYIDHMRVYKKTSYQYTDDEKRIMEKLDFPTALMGSESIFKDGINTESKKENNKINGFYAKSLYNLFTDIKIMSSSRESIVSYYN